MFPLQNLLQLLPLITQITQIAPQIQRWVALGLPVFTELQKAHPNLIPVLEAIGKELFPALSEPIHTVASAADVLFRPNWVVKLQTDLNKIQNSGLTADGTYGKATKAAVLKFQTDHGFTGADLDGWAGPKTQAAITAALVK